MHNYKDDNEVAYALANNAYQLTHHLFTLDFPQNMVYQAIIEDVKMFLFHVLSFVNNFWHYVPFSIYIYIYIKFFTCSNALEL